MDITKILAGDRPAEWFTIPTGGKNEPTVLVKIPSPKLLREMGRQAGITEARRFEEDDLSNEAFLSDLVDYMILEWKNIRTGGDGAKATDLPCNRENKVLLMDNWLEFYSVILDILIAHRVKAEKVREKDEKNS